MITSKDIEPVIQALETISVKGSGDVGTMNNIFKYLIKLQQEIDAQNKEMETGDAT